ncbi:MAG TPA: HIT family protein [Leucothrix mucor]|uniref:HIT family protein n=1 Tax=Leucothrix mucor TaxID=45248 RepID=A0A7V2WV24_LEUMU|nr:HIT family protein [Leucothrix mucor]
MSENTDCPLCSTKDMVIEKGHGIENELAYVLTDTNPVSIGHCLIVPRRHVAEFFDATKEEKLAIFDLIDEMKVIIDKKHNPDGYNIGVNIGKAAGQSVPHIHIHMMPRYMGDIENPRGGVRGVIPAKQKYE